MPYICKPNIAKIILQTEKTIMHTPRELLYIIIKKEIDNGLIEISKNYAYIDSHVEKPG